MARRSRRSAFNYLLVCEESNKTSLGNFFALAQHKLCHVCSTLHTSHAASAKTLVPGAAANFKRVLVGWEEKAHANPGCHCGFIPLARAQASLIERLLLQLGLGSLNWLPDPPSAAASPTAQRLP